MNLGHFDALLNRFGKTAVIIGASYSIEAAAVEGFAISNLISAVPASAFGVAYGVAFSFWVVVFLVAIKISLNKK